MRLINQDLILSATDLANHQRCERLVQLDRWQALEIAAGASVPEQPPSLAARKGIEHEAEAVAAEIARVQADGGRILDLRGPELSAAAKRDAMREAIQAGVELIVQAPLRAGRMRGFADLLRRVEDAATPGGELQTIHRYEPIEIKYARSERPAFTLQVCVYAAALAQLVGEEPGLLHVWTSAERHAYPSVDFMAHYRAAVVQLEADLQLELDAQLAAAPAKIGHCDGCDWSSRCSEQRVVVDHLSQVAGIRQSQIGALSEHDVQTMTALAASELQVVAGIGQGTFERLRSQARLQHDQRSEAPGRAWEFRSPDGAGRGFARLPAADPADMFFDFEGYPYHEAGAFEYLWGWSFANPDGKPPFDYIWCDTEEGERDAFARFLTLATELRTASPGMHVYHYAPYEITQLKRLADKHPDLAAPLWPLLSDGVFVDLYAVVYQSMIIGVPSYSIKKLEPLYGRVRAGDAVDNAADSIVQYEEWLASGDLTIQREILHYNNVDCDSTIELRDWLLERRDEALAEGVVWEPAELDPEREERELTEEQQIERETTRAALELLEEASRGELPSACDALPEPLRAEIAKVAGLLGAMPGWQRRENAQFFGELHGSAADATPEDFVAQPESMGALRLVSTEDVKRGTMLRTYHGPPQDSLAKADQVAYDPLGVRKVGLIKSIDAAAGTIVVKTTGGDQRWLDQSGGFDWEKLGAILGRTEIPVAKLEALARTACVELASHLRIGRDPFTANGDFRTVYALLAGRGPQPAAQIDGAPLIEGAPTPMALADVIEQMTDAVLAVQGPPGTGKTWTSARAIAELVARGRTVGISSNSHAAIRNLILGIDCHLAEVDAPAGAKGLRIAYNPGGDGKWAGAPERVDLTDSKGARAAVETGRAMVLAGTAWMYAGVDVPLDAVFVDEAGQVSLLHATSIAAATRRLVLVGDPQQLAQPSPVAHPHGADQSPLDLIFAGADTLSADRGVLLPTTRRMHPAIAGWISDAFYEGRVEAHPPTAHHVLNVPADPALSGSGLRLATVAHAGCSTSSPAEAVRIAELVASLLAGGTYVDHDSGGNATAPRPLTLEDIVIVAPYNRQVACLVEHLPDGARVGTVDKFQGQEAAVAIWSVTASSVDDVPRGLDFLLSPNRMNVAVSRARALAIVVASPELLTGRARTVEEMRLINRLQLFAERAMIIYRKN